MRRCEFIVPAVWAYCFVDLCLSARSSMIAYLCNSVADGRFATFRHTVRSAVRLGKENNRAEYFMLQSEKKDLQITNYFLILHGISKSTTSQDTCKHFYL